MAWSCEVHVHENPGDDIFNKIVKFGAYRIINSSNGDTKYLALSGVKPCVDGLVIEYELPIGRTTTIEFLNSYGTDGEVLERISVSRFRSGIQPVEINGKLEFLNELCISGETLRSIEAFIKCAMMHN